MRCCDNRRRTRIEILTAGLWLLLIVFCLGQGIRSAEASLILPEFSSSSVQILETIERPVAFPFDLSLAFGEPIESTGAAAASENPFVSTTELSDVLAGVSCRIFQHADFNARSCQPESSSSAPTTTSGPLVSSAILTPDSELVSLELLSFWRPGLFINVPAPPTSELLRPPQPC